MEISDSRFANILIRKFGETVLAYQEPHRFYHVISHIMECLQAFDRVYHMLEDPDAVEYALIFHDFVYVVDPLELAKENEERSAAYACEGLDASEVERITNLIMVTKHSEDYPPRSIDEQYMCDIDLLRLADTPDQFMKHSLNIRKEYQHIPLDIYVPARVDLLQSLLGHKHLFYTETFRSLCEVRARENILKEITNLNEMLLLPR